MVDLLDESFSKTLLSIFPNGISLRKYLSSMQNQILQDNDSKNYIDFITNTYIIPTGNDSFVNINSLVEPELQQSHPNIRDIINRLVANIVRNSNNTNYREQNVLTLGYRMRSSMGDNSRMRGQLDTECYFVNTIQTLVTNKLWQLLADRIGELMIKNIFSQPVFIESSNGCYIQVSGTIASELIYQKHMKDKGSKLNNKLISEFIKKNNVQYNCIFHNSEIFRYKIFYKSNYEKCLGLPAKHIVNEILSLDNNDNKNIEEKIEFLVDLIFHNATLFINHSDDMRYKNIHNVVLIPLVNNILKNINQCDFSATMEKFCCIRSSGESCIEKNNNNNNKDDLKNKNKQNNNNNHSKDDGGNKYNYKNKKKTRRGCRGGKLVKTKTENLNNSDFNNSFFGDCIIKNKSKLNKKRKFSALKTTTVGASLFNNMMNNIKIDSSFREDGFCTQENENAFDYEFSTSKKKRIIDDTNIQFTDNSAISSKDVTDDNLLNKEFFILDSNSNNNNNNDYINFSIDSVNKSFTPVNAKNDSNDEMGTNSEITVNKSKNKRKRYMNLNKFIYGRRGDVQKPIDNNDNSNSGTINISLPRSDSGIAHNFSRKLIASNVKETKSSYSPKDKLKRKFDDTDPAFNILSLSTDINNVCEFIKSICRRVFTIKDIWGTRHNMNAFLANLDTYVKMNRYETIYLHQTLIGVNISKLSIVSFFDQTNKKIDYILREQLVFCLISWIYNDFVNPILSNCFYITEAEGRGNEVLYFRKAVWSYIVKQGLNQMKTHFAPISLDPELPKRKSRRQEKLDKAASMSSLLNDKTSIITFPKNSFLLNDLLKQNKKFVVPQVSLLNNLFLDNSSSNVNVSNKNATANSNNSNAKTYNLIPKIRFVPKSNSVRAITNMSRYNKQSMNRSFNDVLSNASLYNCLHVLRYMQLSRPYLCGFGVFGIDDIYLRLSHYKFNLNNDQSISQNQTSKSVYADVASENNHPKLYFATLDIEKCYDNIDTNILYDIIKNIFNNVNNSSSNEKVIHKYSINHYVKSMNRVISKNIRHVTPSDDIIPFQEASKEIASRYRNSLISDSVIYSKLNDKEFFKVLKTHLFSHIVKIPKISGENDIKSQYHTQVKGIPQGSVLSPLLCNVYFGNIEEKMFGDENDIIQLGIHNNQSLIIRMMDDYLMISTDPKCVQYFVQNIYHKLKTYKSSINYRKTKVNFDMVIDFEGEKLTLNKISTPYLPWCGFFFDMNTLEVKPNFTKLIERPLEFSISLELNNYSLAFKKNIKCFIRMKLHAILLDNIVLNTKLTTLQTLFNMFILTAIRTYCYIKKLKEFQIKFHPEFIYNSLLEGILFASRLIHSRTRHKTSRRLNFIEDSNIDQQETLFSKCVTFIEPNSFGKSLVRSKETIWLGLNAFSKVFNFRKAEFVKVLKLIDSKLFITKKLDEKNELVALSELGDDYQQLLYNSLWL